MSLPGPPGWRRRRSRGFEKRVDDVDDQQKKGDRRQRRKHDRPESSPSSGAIDRRGFDQRFGYSLQASQEEQKVVADLLPYRSHHDQRHCVVSVQQVVPLVPDQAQCIRNDADRRCEHEEPQDAGHRRRDGIRPDQQGLVDGCAVHYAIREDCQHQRDRQAAPSDQHRKYRSRLERCNVGLVSESCRKFSSPTNSRVAPNAS